MKVKLEKLGYTQKWLEYGLLDEKNLKSQIEEYDKGIDLNTEHYRYSTFLNWFNKKEKITSEEIDKITFIIE